MFMIISWISPIIRQFHNPKWPQGFPNPCPNLSAHKYCECVVENTSILQHFTLIKFEECQLKCKYYNVHNIVYYTKFVIPQPVINNIQNTTKYCSSAENEESYEHIFSLQTAWLCSTQRECRFIAVRNIWRIEMHTNVSGTNRNNCNSKKNSDDNIAWLYTWYQVLFVWNQYGYDS